MFIQRVECSFREWSVRSERGVSIQTVECVQRLSRVCAESGSIQI